MGGFASLYHRKSAITLPFLQYVIVLYGCNMVLLFGESLARAKRLKPLSLLALRLMAQLLPLSGVAAISGG